MKRTQGFSNGGRWCLGALMLMSFVLMPLMFGCSAEEAPYSTVREVRTPVLQLLQKSDVASPGADTSRCLELATGAAGANERWCQQYPVRPGGPVLVRVVALSPAGGSLEVELTSLRQLQNVPSAGRGGRIGGVNAANTRPVSLADFSPQTLTALKKTLVEAPLRIEEHYFQLTLPSAETLIDEFLKSGALPGYSLNYVSRNPGFREDKGLVSFYVLPAPESPLFEAAASGRLGGGAVSEADLASAKSLAKSNTPPVILSLTPDGGVLPGGSETRLQLTLGSDPDAGAASRVQWFVSSGELTNSVSRQPKWKPDTKGPVTAFAMLRDLQGGSDFAYRVFTAE